MDLNEKASFLALSEKGNVVEGESNPQKQNEGTSNVAHDDLFFDEP